MNTKVVAFVTIAVGATALGGVMLLSNAGKDKPVDQPALALNSNAGQAASYFDSNLPSEPQDTTPVRTEIDTQGRSGGASQDARGGWGAMMDRMTEFDLDGDGILSEEERRAMMEAMRQEWINRFDLDGDGELSREERMAARQAMFEQSPRGQELMRQFDADGDGVLNEEEQAAMETFQREQREQQRAEQLARYDTNGDGELSRDERQAQREEQRGRWGDTMRDAQTEFDRDGDGQLSIEESQEAFAVMQERREIDRFIRDFDSDGNGSFGPADYNAFLSDYDRGDLGADVNGDGEVNSQDLAAYTDMVTRSRNRP